VRRRSHPGRRDGGLEDDRPVGEAGLLELARHAPGEHAEVTAEGAERGERLGRDAVQAQLGQRAHDGEREAGPVGDGCEVGEPAFREDEVDRTRRDRGEREAGRRRAPIPRQRRRREAHREAIERQAEGAEAGTRAGGRGTHEVVARLPARADDEHLRGRRTGPEPRGRRGEAGGRVGADDEALSARHVNCRLFI